MITMQLALEEYTEYRYRRVQTGKLKSSTVETTRARQDGFLESVMQSDIKRLTPSKVLALCWDYLDGRRPETVRGAVRECQTFGRWLVKRKLLKSSPFESPEIEEFIEDECPKPKQGAKPTLKVDGARQLLHVALVEAQQAPQSAATCVLLCLLMGLRATEAVSITPEAVDDNGRLLHIEDSKTAAGVRVLEVPEMLRELLLRACSGYASDYRVFQLTRYGLYSQANRLCREAGVKEVGCHGLRRTHATLARQAGLSGPVVAAALGHTNDVVTHKHYVAPGTQAREVNLRALQRLKAI